MRGYTRRTHTPNQTTIQIIVPKGSYATVEKFRKAFPYMMDAMREDAMEYWEFLASNALNRSRDKYLEAMTSHATSKDNFVLSLQGRIPTMIEDGWDPYDMKIAFSRSTKLREGKMRIPADKRSELTKVKHAAPTKWMIIPLDTRSGLVYRMYTTNQPSDKWQNKGWYGHKLLDEVNDYLVSELIDKHVTKMLEKLF